MKRYGRENNSGRAGLRPVGDPGFLAAGAGAGAAGGPARRGGPRGGGRRAAHRWRRSVRCAGSTRTAGSTPTGSSSARARPCSAWPCSACWPCWRSGRSGRAQAGRASARPPWPGRRPPPGCLAAAVVGTRNAFEPGAGVRAVPVRSALLGSIAAVTAVVTAVVFSASLSGLSTHPARYGWNWDLAIQAESGVRELRSGGDEEADPGPACRGRLVGVRVRAASRGRPVRPGARPAAPARLGAAPHHQRPRALRSRPDRAGHGDAAPARQEGRGPDPDRHPAVRADGRDHGDGDAALVRRGRGRSSLARAWCHDRRGHPAGGRGRGRGAAAHIPVGTGLLLGGGDRPGPGYHRGATGPAGGPDRLGQPGRDSGRQL